MTSANSHVSTVIDLDRLNVISIENVIDDGALSNSDISISNQGSGYVNVMPQAVTATLSGGGTTNGATLNVHVEVTMNVVSTDTPAPTLASANGGYTVSAVAPAAFKLGEGVMANCASDVNANNSGIYGIVTAVTHLEGNTSKNVSL